jgi:hypothetical protein
LSWLANSEPAPSASSPGRRSAPLLPAAKAGVAGNGGTAACAAVAILTRWELQMESQSSAKTRHYSFQPNSCRGGVLGF